MSDSSASPAEAPRSWGPIVAALAIALVVIIGAIVWFFVGAPVSTQQQQAIDACEELAAQAGLPEIVRGDVSGPDSDGVFSIAWEFEDGTRGGCDARHIDEGMYEPTLVGDIVEDM